MVAPSEGGRLVSQPCQQPNIHARFYAGSIDNRFNFYLGFTNIKARGVCYFSIGPDALD